MNEFTVRIKKGLFLIICLAFAVTAKAQNPTYQLYITNEVLISPTEYRFDIFLLRTGATTFQLATVQFGLGFDTNIVNGGTVTPSILAGSSELTNPSQFPTTVTVGVTNFNVGGIIYRYYNLAPPPVPGAGNGSIISNVNSGCNHPGTRLATFILTNTVPFKSGSQCNHIFSTAPQTGRTNTLVNAYVGPTNTNVTVTANHLGYNSTPTCDLNPLLNNCTPPTLSTSQVNISCVPNNPTGSATVTTTGGSSPFTYLWSNSTTGSVTLGSSKDNSIYEQNQNNSNGAGEYVFAGELNNGLRNRAVMAFDLSSIPAGATITGVTLSLHASQPGVTGPQLMDLRKLSENWGEGTSNAGSPGGLGTAATTNDATWLNRFHPSTAWTTAGGTFSGTVSGSQTVDAVGFYNWSSAGMIADVQGWLNNSASNFGWLIKGQENGIHQAKRFDTKENITPANRPVLTVTYITNTTNTISNLAAGTYTVTVTATGGCTATASVTITGNTTPPTVGASASPAAICLGGSSTLTGSGADTYSWQPGSLTGTTVSVSPASTTTYTVTGTTTATGCTATATVQVTVDTPIPVDAGPDNAVCDGGSAQVYGQINGLTSGPSGTWSTSGSGNFTPSNAWNGLNGVDYNTGPTDGGTTVILTLTGPANGACPAQSSNLNLVVNNNPSITVGPVPAICQGSTSFTIPFTVNGGGPDNYNLEPGSGNPYPGFSATGGVLPVSPITVTVSGAAVPGNYNFDLSVFNSITFCFDFHQVILTVNGATAAITPSSGTLTCSTTSILLTASGGGTYLWDDSSTNSTRTVSAAGTYTVTVTDGINGCTATATAVIGSNLAPPAAAITPSSGTLTCTTTSILLTASGGGTYLWDNGSTNAGLSVSAAGTYTVTVTDAASGCTASAQAVIGSNTTSPAAAITPSSGTLTCTTTSILLTASGGGTYLWDNGSTNAGLSVSAAGTYTVTVTDATNGCTASAQAVIGSNTTAPAAAITPSSGTLTCALASINLLASGGGTYLWDNGSTNAGRSVSAAGTYTVTVTDGTNGCTASAQATIGGNTTPPAAAITPSSGTITCTVTSINLLASGGGTYLWNNGSTNASRTVSAAGTYTVTVTDPANGCTASAQATITGNTTPPAASASASPAAICTGGSSTLTATGGGTYLWDDGSTNAARAVSVTGTYTVTVTGANGCTATATVTVTPGANPIILSAMKTDASFGGPTGTAGVTFSPSGCTIVWSPGSETTSYIEKKPAGTYTATVTHPGSGCTKVRSVTIN